MLLFYINFDQTFIAAIFLQFYSVIYTSFPIHELDNVILSNHSGGYTSNTNKEVNKDILNIIRKLREENYEDRLNLKNLL